MQLILRYNYFYIDIQSKLNKNTLLFIIIILLLFYLKSLKVLSFNSLLRLK